jgi:hypothetical protein
MKGVIGGAIAGALKDIPDAIFHYILKITDITFWDYAGIIVLKRHPEGILEHVYSFLYEVTFSILIAVIYIHLIPYLQTKHYLLRGAVFGAIVWFFIQAAALAFRIEAVIVRSDLITSIVNSVNSLIYGMILAYVIHALEKRGEGLKNSFQSAAEIRSAD